MVDGYVIRTRSLGGHWIYWLGILSGGWTTRPDWAVEWTTLDEATLAGKKHMPPEVWEVSEVVSIQTARQ